MPGSDGVYSILESGVRTRDVKFEEIYEEARGLKRKNGSLAPAPGVRVDIAVLDSGVVSQGDDYFGDRVVNSGNAQGGYRPKKKCGECQGTGATEDGECEKCKGKGEVFGEFISYGTPSLTRGLPATQGQHGSHVTSIAASGTALIKIIDVQTGSTQEGGKVELPVWVTAFKWAIEQGARIVNVSVVCPWSEVQIKSIVKNNTGVLFLATSGNADTEFTATYRTQNGFDEGNVILVGGCARDGTKQAQRGHGPGIDIFVPSVNVPGLISKRFAQETYYQRDLAERNNQDKRLDKDREFIAGLKQKLELDPDNARLKSQLAREEKRLVDGVGKLPQVPASASVYPLNELAQRISDSGVSFGIPMVANVAAKMMLIMPNITPTEVISVMKSNAETCEAGRVLDPSKCYKAALEMRKQWFTRI